ncbi:hypothetical protein [Cellulosimicrobium sp. Marseille-Q4280]|uniref:hypothetical protein n=1 Tax=Cellulosimicrobium sp. Marseille-Q4280 TaxID=2937992 RepID=UPI00203E6864|nr:hypothetical protein [Cellulosimicrobium sp. Marseille-Q4280]
MMATYSLTHMTGKPAQANRIAVVQGFEAKRRTWIVLLVALFVMIMATGILWPVLSTIAVLPGFAAAAGTYFALTMRSKAEPDRLWVSARRDRMRSDAGLFFVCGEQVDPTFTQVYCLMRATVPNPEMTVEPSEPTTLPAGIAEPANPETEGSW